MEDRTPGHRPRLFGFHHVEQDWLDGWQRDCGSDPCDDRLPSQCGPEPGCPERFEGNDERYPVAIGLVSLVILLFYKLDEPTMAKIKADLDERRKASETGAAPHKEAVNRKVRNDHALTNRSQRSAAFMPLHFDYSRRLTNLLLTILRNVKRRERRAPE